MKCGTVLKYSAQSSRFPRPHNPDTSLSRTNLRGSRILLYQNPTCYHGSLAALRVRYPPGFSCLKKYGVIEVAHKLVAPEAFTAKIKRYITQGLYEYSYEYHKKLHPTNFSLANHAEDIHTTLWYQPPRTLQY